MPLATDAPGNRCPSAGGVRLADQLGGADGEAVHISQHTRLHLLNRREVDHNTALGWSVLPRKANNRAISSTSSGKN